VVISLAKIIMNTDTDLNFQEVIPQLAALYRQGILVPFIGAGMSRGVCCGWEDLLRNLALELNISLPASDEKNKITSSEIIRLADEIVSSLRPHKIPEQIRINRKALLEKPENKEIPKQVTELAKLYWPLVITTNYDDVFWSAAHKHQNKDKIDILGRSAEDCHAILHSLDEVASPKLWAIQGFIGGQLSDVNQVIDDPAKQNELADQIVLGHQQYQKAINNSIHFRRAFAEVFRRRSLLFLGSGILEDYLVNLFSEILHHQGCGPYPHFALLKRSEKKRYDNLFMQQRLGIVPIFYDNHDDLPKHLQTLSDLIKFWLQDMPSSNKPVTSLIFQDEIGFKLAANSAEGTVPLKINICKNVLPVPNADYNECSVVSVGREDNYPREGSQAKSLIKSYPKKNTNSKAKPWKMVDKAPSYVFRYLDSPIFGIAARRRDAHIRKHATRDLGIIPEAVCVLLRELDLIGFDTVHISAIAAGKHRCWDPIHPFAQTLCGIRKFVAENQVNHIKKIILYIIDPATWSAIVTRKIPVETLLTSGISTHNVKTTDSSGFTESFSITLKESPTLEQLLKLCKLNPHLWKASVFPLPVEENEIIPDDMIITSTMRLNLVAK
jgi:SIR2-like domain